MDMVTRDLLVFALAASMMVACGDAPGLPCGMPLLRGVAMAPAPPSTSLAQPAALPQTPDLGPAYPYLQLPDLGAHD